MISDVTLTLTDSELQPGDEMGIYVADLAPDSAVEIWLHSEPRLMQTATADAAGEVRTTLTIPDDTEIGQHSLVVRGTDTDGEAVVVEMPFVVRAGESALDGVLIGGLALLLSASLGLIGFAIWRGRRKRGERRRL